MSEILGPNGKDPTQSPSVHFGQDNRGVNPTMVELQWRGRQLQIRQRGFYVDASGALCGMTDFGDWKTVKDCKELPSVITNARAVVEAYECHGIGPEFPELQESLERLKAVLERSIWSKYPIN